MKGAFIVCAVRFAAVVFLAVSFAGCQEVRVDLTVVDEAGDPVVGAEARLSARDAIASGWGWGSGRENVSAELTDENGQVSLRSSGSAGSASVGAEKEGYYRSSMRLDLDGVDESGEAWRLANDDLKLVLRRKVNPVPMYAKKVEVPIPVEGEPMGFDLMVGDWVAPHGAGEVADLIMTLHRAEERRVMSTGLRKREVTLFDVRLKIEFSNAYDGIALMSSDQPTYECSEYKWPYQAPLDGYESDRYIFQSKKEVNSGVETNIDLDNRYLFRVRSVVSDDGELISALYGKVGSEIRFPNLSASSSGLSFIYYLNPEPNSRDMEFDPQQNLFGELPPRNRVRLP